MALQKTRHRTLIVILLHVVTVALLAGYCLATVWGAGLWGSRDRLMLGGILVTLSLGTLCGFSFCVWALSRILGVARNLDTKRFDLQFGRALSGAAIGCVCAVLLSIYPKNILSNIEAGNVAWASNTISHVEGLVYHELLQDIQRTSLLDLFEGKEAILAGHSTYAEAWNHIIPELLYHGRAAAVEMKPGIRERLRERYLSPDALVDPWGNPYQFFAGPLTHKVYAGTAATEYFRAYCPGGTADCEVPDDLPIYIWSLGKDGKSYQRIGPGAGDEAGDASATSGKPGDDINNWDGRSSWLAFYKKGGM